MAQLTDRAKKMLLGVVEWMDPADNPLVQCGPSLFMMYDRISLSAANDEFGGVICTFWWRGHEMAFIRNEGAKILGNNESLYLGGVEGVLEVLFS